MINRAAARAYRDAMHDFAGMRTLDVWYARLDIDELLPRMRERRLAQGARAHGGQRRQGARQDEPPRVREADRAGPRRSADRQSDPPLITPIEDLASPEQRETITDAVRAILQDYLGSVSTDHRRLLERFRYVHAARKVVGVGSVGTRAWITLLLGSGDDDPLFLQIKEAQPSVLEPFLGRSRFGNHGRRVVEGQRLMQSASDIMLGWIHTRGLDGAERDFYVRQLWDQKGSALVDLMSPLGLERYAEVCGWTLARAHARSGDPVALAAYLGKGAGFDRAMATFAELYADQNDRDYAAVREAVATGRLTAETGL